MAFNLVETIVFSLNVNDYKPNTGRVIELATAFTQNAVLIEYQGQNIKPSWFYLGALERLELVGASEAITEYRRLSLGKPNLIVFPSKDEPYRLRVKIAYWLTEGTLSVYESSENIQDASLDISVAIEEIRRQVQSITVNNPENSASPETIII